MPYQKKYACADCEKPDTAFRPGTRCRGCSHLNNLRITRECKQRTRQRLRKTTTHKRLPALPCVVPTTDLDVQRYRAEKKAAESRHDAQLADARRLFLLLQEAGKPKRGRPKQSIGRAENASERAA